MYNIERQGCVCISTQGRLATYHLTNQERIATS